MAKKLPRKAIFFDRDGIVNKRLVGDYIKTPSEFEFNNDFFSLFSFAHQNGYLTILVSNQQGVGKGVMTSNDLEAVTKLMQDELYERTGFIFDDVFYCTHLASSQSTHRKPAPGMLLDAILSWNINIHGSWMIGDSISDAQAGKNAQVRTILVGDYKKEDVSEWADYAVADCTEALDVLISHTAEQIL